MTNNFNSTQKILITTLALLLTTGLATAEDTALELTGDLDLNDNNLQVEDDGDSVSLFNYDESNPFIGTDLVNTDSIEADAVTAEEAQLSDQFENSGDIEISTDAIGDDEADISLSAVSDSGELASQDAGNALNVEGENVNVQEGEINLEELATSENDENVVALNTDGDVVYVGELGSDRVDFTQAEASDVDLGNVRNVDLNDAAGEALEYTDDNGEDFNIQVDDDTVEVSEDSLQVGEVSTSEIAGQAVTADELASEIDGNGIEAGDGQNIAVELGTSSGLEFDSGLNVEFGDTTEYETGVEVTEGSIEISELQSAGDLATESESDNFVWTGNHDFSDNGGQLVVTTESNPGELSETGELVFDTNSDELVVYDGTDNLAVNTGEVDFSNLNADQNLDLGDNGLAYDGSTTLVESSTGEIQSSELDENGFEWSEENYMNVENPDLGDTEVNLGLLLGDTISGNSDLEVNEGNGLHVSGSALAVQSDGDSIDVGTDGISVLPENIDVEGFDANSDENAVLTAGTGGDDATFVNGIDESHISTSGQFTGSDELEIDSLSGDEIDSGTVDRAHIDTSKTTQTQDDNSAIEVETDAEIVTVSEHDGSNVDLSNPGEGREVTIVHNDASDNIQFDEADFIGGGPADLTEQGDTATVVNTGTEWAVVSEHSES